MGTPPQDSPPLPRPPFFTLAQAAKAGDNPEKFFRECFERSGDPFCVTLPGAGDIYFTGTREGAKEIFAAKTGTFEPLTPNPIEPMLGSGSLILIGGDSHRRERKLLTPPFHGERMRAYGEVIQQVTLEHMGRWTSGQSIDVEKTMQEITLGVIIRAVFGVEDPARIDQFIHCIEAFSTSYTQPLFMFPWLRKKFLGLGPWNKFVQARAAFDEVLDEEINQRREKGTDGREDILSLMLDVRYDDGTALDGEELKDELRTLLVAGHETSATGLAWALSYLSYLPEIRKSLHDELAPLGASPSPEILVQQPYLEATCKEALRVHPVVPIALRRVMQPFTLRGHSIPVGKGVAVGVSLLHHDESIWDKPLEFNPQRFIDKKYTPFEFAPFGGGARRCIGAAFANYEMKVVLGTLMGKGEFGDLAEEPAAPKMRSITDGFRKPVFLEYRGRRNS